jgi:2-oxoglutarate/2-oxoacid ferredoxin oxidoreductase subunit alpha
MEKEIIFTDSSRLITESMAEAGADVFVGYPITPANLLYSYSSQRFPVFLAAPDEITTLQWMSGFSAAGKIPVTATSFPGYALMIEGINMAYMMELPMIIILVQRLGPATGTATRGSQGDISVLHGTISGGLSIPTFSLSDTKDCWEIPAKAVQVADKYRTPVVILTSKEEVMTMSCVNRGELKPVAKIQRSYYNSDEPYIPYKAGENLVSDFLPLTNNKHQVRFTASTHDTKGIIQNSSKEALDNSKRLHYKVEKNLKHFTYYDLDEQKEANTLIVSFGITAQAAKEAVKKLRSDGIKVTLLIANTLFPVPPVYFEIFSKYKRIIVAEENLTGQYRQILFGTKPDKNINGVNEFGNMVKPISIINEVLKYEHHLS